MSTSLVLSCTCSFGALKVAEDFLIQHEWADAAVIASWREEAAQQVEQTVAQVQREPGPDPYSEDWCALASKNLLEPSQS